MSWLLSSGGKENLKGDSRYVSKYLLAFTDLIRMAHVRIPRSVGQGKQRIFLRPRPRFPWQSFQGCALSQSLGSTGSEAYWHRQPIRRPGSQYSAPYTLPLSIFECDDFSPPPRPMLKLTDAEQEADRSVYRNGEYPFDGIDWGFCGGSHSFGTGCPWGYLRRKRPPSGPAPHPFLTSSGE